MTTVLTFLAGVIVSIGSYLGVTHIDTPQPIEQPEIPVVEVSADSEEDIQLGAVSPAGLFPYYLAGGGMSSSATSFTLSSFTLPQNDYPIQDSDLSDTFYLTLEPGNTSKQEFISCTTVGTNTGTTVTISGCTRGLSPITPYTASTTLQFSHSGGAAVIFGDSPQLFNQYGALANDEAITGFWTVPDPTAAQGIASRQFVLDTANGGAVSFDQEIVAGTAGETIAQGEIVYFDEFQDEWMLADASVGASSTSAILGIAQGAGTDGNSVTGGVLISGLDTTNIGGTAGDFIYVSDTAGATSTSPGTNSTLIGQIKDTSGFYFVPDQLNSLKASQDITFTGDNTFTGTNTLATSTTIGSTNAFSIGKFQQVFTGDGTFTVPNGIERVYIEAIGGGAGGGQDGGSAGGGGGGGAYCAGFVDVSATSSIAVTIGSGGAAETNGGNTLFSTFVTAGAGTGASDSTAGSGGDCTLDAAVVDFLEIENFDGEAGVCNTNPAPNACNSGKGGGNIYGEGGAPVTDDNPGANGNTNGRNGTGYGTGGSGAIKATGAGVGRAGLLIIRW